MHRYMWPDLTWPVTFYKKMRAFDHYPAFRYLFITQKFESRSNCPASNVSGELLCWSAILLRRNDKSRIVSPLVPCKKTNRLERWWLVLKGKSIIIIAGSGLANQPIQKVRTKFIKKKHRSWTTVDVKPRGTRLFRNNFWMRCLSRTKLRQWTFQTPA